jgi:hypothetical protein
MGKEDKCFTKKNKTGGSYTTCVDKKGDQLREKDVKPKKKKLVLKKTAAKPRPKPPPPPGMSQSVADALIKKANKAREAKAAPKKKVTKLKIRKPKTAPIQNVSAITAATSASAPRAAPPAANYNMLRPELRKHIIGYIRGEEFSPSKMKKAQIDRMYGMIEEDEDFGEARRDRFDSHIEYGGEYRQGYFQDKYGDVIDSRYDRADTKFRKDTKTGFIKFLKAGGDSNRGVVSGKYDKKTMKELIDVFVNEY